VSSIVDYPFSPADVVEFFRQNYGPTTCAFATLGEADQAALRAALVELWTASETNVTSELNYCSLNR
jgi:hypothetical protein